jgi:hypothetical protein
MKTITIANTPIPIKFGMYVLGTFLRERKLKLSDLSLLGEDLLLALELAFTGVEHGYKAKGEKCPYNLQSFCDLVDTDMGGIARIMEMISNEISPPQDDTEKNVVAKEENSHLNTSNAFVSEY